MLATVFTGSVFFWAFFLNGSSSSSSDSPNNPFLDLVYLAVTGGFVYFTAEGFDCLIGESYSSDDPNKPFLDLA